MVGSLCHDIGHGSIHPSPALLHIIVPVVAQTDLKSLEEAFTNGAVHTLRNAKINVANFDLKTRE